MLSYDVVPYITDKNSPYFTSLIFRTRGGLLDLNALGFKNNSNKLCPFCNLNEEENTFHFVARCPIFGYDRKNLFGKEVLNDVEFIDILNGKCYYALFKFINCCMKYRQFILIDCY